MCALLVTPDPRFRLSHVLAIALALGACNASGGSTALDAQDDPDTSTIDQDADTAGKRRDAGPKPDAGPTTDARPPSSDAGSPGTDAGGSPSPDAGGSGGGTGTVSCYSAGSPSTTCTLPTHCCFNNYSSQHDGECTTSSCTWGTIDCDGPEDCASGQHCCAHAIIDPVDGILGYKLACQSTACGPAPANQELCHTTSSSSGTCPTGRTCVSALGNDNDLPRSLYICR